MKEGSISEIDLRGRSEEARVKIAQRIGFCLSQHPVPDADRRAAELVARRLVEDAVERVRCALSMAINGARYLPRDLALRLAHDVDSVACPFLEVTEVFSEDDWQQLILTISRSARVAVARRSSMTEPLAKSLAELGDTVVAETLIENSGAPMTEPVCQSLIDRFSSEVWVLDKLALRNDLVAGIVVRLTTKVSEAARQKLAKTYQLQDYTEPVVAEAEIAAILNTVKKVAAEELVPLAEALHEERKLTPLLILDALREQKIGFVEAALTVIAARSLEHVRSVVHRANRDPFRDLLTRAQVPASMRQDFWNEIEMLRQK